MGANMMTPLHVLTSDEITAIEEFEENMSQYNPYCPHGVYVGGCGIDWMCHDCEMGYCAICGDKCNYGLDCIARLQQRLKDRQKSLAREAARMVELEYELMSMVTVSTPSFVESIEQYMRQQFRAVIAEQTRRDRLGLEPLHSGR